MDFALSHWPNVEAQPQEKRDATFYARRTPKDSELNPAKTIAEQFDLLRVADSQRYPAFFYYRGHRYLIKLEKSESSSDE